MSTLGYRIRKVRENLNLTGEEFGKKLNVTKVAVSNWENNNRKPDAEMLIKIADLGNISTDHLLGRTNDSNFNIYEKKEEQTSYNTLNKAKEILDTFKKAGINPEDIDLEELQKILKTYVLFNSSNK